MNYGKSFFRLYFLETTTEAEKLTVQIFPKHTNDSFSIFFYHYKEETIESIHHSAYLELHTSDIKTIKEATKIYQKFNEGTCTALNLVKILLSMGYSLGEFERYQRGDVYDTLAVTTDNLVNGEFDVWKYGKDSAGGYSTYGYFAGTKKQAVKHVKANYKEYRPEEYNNYVFFLQGTFEAVNLKKQMEFHPSFKLL